MDAEHRHELKQNDLVEWITHFPEYARKNYMQLVGAALVILGLLSWLFWPSVKGSIDNSNLDKQAKVTQVMEQLPGSKSASMRSGMAALPDAFLMTANSLEIEASQAGDPIAKALLLIKRGEALRSAASSARGNPTWPVGVLMAPRGERPRPEARGTGADRPTRRPCAIPRCEWRRRG